MSNIAANERLHSMDALRAVAMLLGVVLHGGMAYMENVWSVWVANDPASSPAFDAMFWIVHLFRMQAFFLIAGFFACMLVARFGAGKFTENRLKRVGLPLVIGLFTVVPLCNAVWTWGFNLRLPLEDQVPLAGEIAGWFGRAFLSQWHLWFLIHLLVMYAVALLWLKLTGAARPIARVGEIITNAWIWCVRHGLAVPALALATFPLLFLQDGAGVDTQSGSIPDLTIVGYYMVFFAGGWMLYRRREHLNAIARLWIPYLIAGLAFSGVFMVMQGKVGINEGDVTPMLRAVSALATAMIVIGFTGFFMHLFKHPSPAMRYVSDSAYWVYLIHLPLVVWLNLIVEPINAGAFTKFGIVMLAATAIMYSSYHVFVRYTWIGSILNGPRLKAERTARRQERRAASALG
jgi:surface polysaccharide O-acyltransferase-like enzyme